MSKDLIKTLQQYVPAQIIRRLAIDPAPIGEATAERFAAAVLFADITDFTALADRFDQQDLGPEFLANLLNDCFGRIIDIVHAHGGEVTKFAGDAIIALWPVPATVARLSPDAQLALIEMARRATQCGLAIQQELSGFEAADGSKLYLQIGIGAGDVYSVYLGGVFDRWEFLLTGTPLVQMSVAKEMAEQSSVVLSPEVSELVREFILVKHLDDGFVQLNKISNPLALRKAVLPILDDTTKMSLQVYLPAAILSRLEAGHAEWLSEVRRVAVMFVKLPQYGTSIKHPYMRTIPEAQAVMEALQTALYRYAGSINKFNVDDKGITLVAGMGLPPLSHGDDSARAVHAAIEIQTALRRLGRRSAIGITTGWVFCGPIGNNLRREYTVVGTTVNMAARLMQAAEQILSSKGLMSAALCDEATFTDIRSQAINGGALASRINFHSIRLTSVKGKIEPIVAFSPSIKTGVDHHSHEVRPQNVRIRGYERERAQLSESLQELERTGENTNSSLIIVEGSAGSGKSLILSELVSHANRLGIRTLVNAGHVLEQITPYYAWRSIFENIFSLGSLLFDQQALRSHVLSQLPAIRGERGYPAFAIGLSPLLNEVLPLEFPENRVTTNMAANTRQHTTLLFLLRLLQRDIAGTGVRKKRPTILVLDNGQWLDEWSWRLILEASREIQSLLTVVASRPLSEQGMDKRLNQVCTWLDNRDDVARLPLGNLETEKELELLSEQLIVDKIPSEALEALRYRANGHPLFSLELVKAWLEMGLLQMDARALSLTTQATDLKTVPAPSTIQRINIGRLERLIPEHQLLLKVASTMGSTFSGKHLERIYPIEDKKEKLSSEIAELERIGLLRRVQDEDDLYRFSSSLIYEATLSLLPQSSMLQLQQQFNSQFGNMPATGT